MPDGHRRERGFTLIELLIVVAIIGIIAAILIPNLLDALQKAKQKRTIADIRNIGTAWMSWLTDQAGAASAGAGKTWNGGNTTTQSYEEVFGYLHPSATFFYMQEVPEFDGWGHEIQFGMNPKLYEANVLIICSGGRNGLLAKGCAGGEQIVGDYLTIDYDRNIIWADGALIQRPGRPPPSCDKCGPPEGNPIDLEVPK